MKYLLDTNTCIRFISGRAPKLPLKFLEIDDADISVSAITKAELFYGSAKSQTPAVSRAKQDEFLSRFQSLVFDDIASDIYGAIRAKLEVRGTPIGQLDLLIASIALVHDLILVTHNVSEFSRVPGLKLEDWEQ